MDKSVLPYTSNFYETSMNFVHSEYHFKVYTSTVKIRRRRGKRRGGRRRRRGEEEKTNNFSDTSL